MQNIVMSRWTVPQFLFPVIAVISSFSLSTPTNTPKKDDSPGCVWAESISRQIDEGSVSLCLTQSQVSSQMHSYK